MGLAAGANASPAQDNLESASFASCPWELSQPAGGPMAAQTNEMAILSLSTPPLEDYDHTGYGFFDSVLKVPASLPVPEPSALSIVALGAAFLLGRRRKKN